MNIAGNINANVQNIPCFTQAYKHCHKQMHIINVVNSKKIFSWLRWTLVSLPCFIFEVWLHNYNIWIKNAVFLNVAEQYVENSTCYEGKSM